MNAPTISFIVAAYQEPERTRMCLEAIARQVYPYYEVIISEDGRLEAKHASLRGDRGDTVKWVPRYYHDVVDGVPVRNIPAVANQGAAAATGDILCFLQQDHIIQPDYGLWLVRCMTSNDIMFGLLDRRDNVTLSDLDALVRNLHLPEAQTRFDMFLDQGRRLLVPFDDWRLTDGFDFSIARARWQPMDASFIGPSHAILDAMITYRMAGLRFVLNPMMRLWHWEHPSRDPANVDELIAASYRKMQEKWGEAVWTSVLVPLLYDFREERKQLQERLSL